MWLQQRWLRLWVSRSVSFGLQLQGAIQGVVFADSNGNGVEDTGETGIGGVVVKLFERTNNQLLAETATDIKGGYRFLALAGGSYRIEIEAPGGYSSLTSTTIPVDLSASLPSGVAVFSLQQSNVILGAVFVDLNGNTLRDVGEQGVAGVEVRIVGELQEDLLSTNAAGEFLLSNPPPGVYTATVVSLEGTGYLPSAEMTRTLYLPTNGTSASALFTVLPVNSIIGNARTGTEVTLEAQSGELRAASNNRTVRANSQGIFVFAGVEDGDYQIVVTSPPGFTSVQSTLAVALRGASSRVVAESVVNGTVQGRLFEDQDQNGLASYREPAVSGAIVQLWREQTLLRETVSTVTGRYQFIGLPVGEYQVIVDSSLFTQLVTTTVSLTNQLPGTNQVVGMGRRGAVSGRIYLSPNASALNPLPAEGVGLSNFTVNLNGPVKRTVQTDVAGFFRFDTLPAGFYELEVSAIPGFTPVNGENWRREFMLDVDHAMNGVNLGLSTLARSEDAPGYGSLPEVGAVIDMGSVMVGSSVSTTLTISETGDATLNVTDFSLSGSNATEFDVSPTSLSIVDGGAAQPVTITCTPNSSGLRTASLTVNHNATDSPATYTLNCMGLSAAMNLWLPVLLKQQLTLVYTSNFSEDAGALWSNSKRSTSPSGEIFLGEFGNGGTSLILEELPAHSRVSVSFDLYILRSWDGNQVELPDDFDPYQPIVEGQAATRIGPDSFQVRSGDTIFLDATFSNWAQFTQNYPSLDSPAQSGAVAVNTLGYTYGDWQKDATYRIHLSFDHSEPMLVLDFLALGLQALEDESWGIDNVSVIVSK